MEVLIDPLLEGPDRSNEVSAINGGYVAWAERCLVFKAVPVQQVSFVPLEVCECGHGMGELFDHLIKRDVTKISCCKGAQHPHADVCGAGPHCQLVLMGDLIVIWRQPSGVWTYEIGEITPGPARYSSKHTQVPTVELLDRRADGCLPYEQPTQKRACKP